jgi:hypothetical protein
MDRPLAVPSVIFPVVIGSGKRLFSDGTIPAGLRLVDSKSPALGS